MSDLGMEPRTASAQYVFQQTIFNLSYIGTYTTILPEMRHIGPGFLFRSCKASRINSTYSASSYSVGFSPRGSFLAWSLEPKCSWTGTELRLRRTKELSCRQAGRLPSCWCPSKVPARYRTCYSWSLRRPQQSPLTGLITCRGNHQDPSRSKHQQGAKVNNRGNSTNNAIVTRSRKVCFAFRSLVQYKVGGASPPSNALGVL